MLEKDQIYTMLQTALVETFEIPQESITPHANIYEDLEIDSIDAIDLIDQIRRETGFKLQSEDFRNIRTIEDIVNTLYAKQQELTPQ